MPSAPTLPKKQPLHVCWFNTDTWGLFFLSSFPQQQRLAAQRIIVFYGCVRHNSHPGSPVLAFWALLQYQYMTCPSKCLLCCRPQGFRHISLDTCYNPLTQAASFLLHGSPQCRSSAFGGYKDKHQQVPSSPNPWRVPVGSLPPTHHPTTTSQSGLFSLTLGAGVMGF